MYKVYLSHARFGGKNDIEYVLVGRVRTDRGWKCCIHEQTGRYHRSTGGVPGEVDRFGLIHGGKGAWTRQHGEAFYNKHAWSKRASQSNELFQQCFEKGQGANVVWEDGLLQSTTKQTSNNFYCGLSG